MSKDSANKTPVIHPFLFALFPVLFLYSHNVYEVAARDTLLPAVVILASTAALFALMRLLTGNSIKAGLIVAVFVILFFSYGHVLEQIEIWDIKNFHKPKHLNRAWIALFACSVYFIIRTRKHLLNLTKILNVVALSLMGIQLFSIAAAKHKTRQPVLVGDLSAGVSESLSLDTGGRPLRDIYYIILDAHARADVLRDVYKYDDRVFFDYLTDKGFYIAEKSRSNYSTTFTSLASSLNMEYVNHMAEALGPNSKSRTPFYEAIENNKVARLLKAVGYKFMHFSSGWGATDRNEYADFDFHPSVADNEFQMVLLRATPLAYFRKNVGVMQARRRILYTFEKLAEACEISGPKFIFAHILCPHPPYLFDADGGIPEWTRLEMDGRAWSKKDLYLDQLVFTQKKTQELIDAILSNSRIAPIIILQADHGTSSIGRPHPPLEDTQEVTDMVSERLRIFNAYYLPGIESGSLYDSITPINTFRIIFNLYFNQDYELLEDRSYYSDYVNPNVLTDVTDRIRDQGEDANPGQLDGDQEGQNGP